MFYKKYTTQLRNTEIINTLLENASTFRERDMVYALTESEVKNVNKSVISDLYEKAINKGYIDFDKIPLSKGDITRFEGYKNMIDSLELLRTLSVKSSVNIDELNTVELSVKNLEANSLYFEKGFYANNDFIMMYYNSLVLACVEATSLLISSYVDYVKRVDTTEFVLLRGVGIKGNLCIDSLAKFNKTVTNGDFVKSMNALLNDGKSKLLGMDDMAMGAMILVLLSAIVPILRTLIYYFYYSRMKVSDYLYQQALFLEMNKVNVQSSTIPTKKKNEILKKQTQYIKDMTSLADKIKVSGTISTQKADKDVKKEKKEWTLDNIKPSISNDGGGFSLL